MHPPIEATRWQAAARSRPPAPRGARVSSFPIARGDTTASRGARKSRLVRRARLLQRARSHRRDRRDLRQLGREVLAGIDEAIELDLVLPLVELAVAPVASEQLVVRAALDDLAALEHQDLVRAA